SAVEENVFHPYNYYKSDKLQVEGGTVHDVKPEGWGTISYLEGVARSSNVAFVNLVESMGVEKWKEHMDEFGFGQSTNSGLLSESAGSNPFQWPIQKVNTAFGQGVTVTVLQMMQAFSAVANEGQMMKPYFVDKIVDPATGKVQQMKPEILSSPISKEAAAKTLDYLKEPVYSE